MPCVSVVQLGHGSCVPEPTGFLAGPLLLGSSAFQNQGKPKAPGTRASLTNASTPKRAAGLNNQCLPQGSCDDSLREAQETGAIHPGVSQLACNAAWPEHHPRLSPPPIPHSKRVAFPSAV